MRLPHARTLEDAAEVRQAVEEERRLAYVGATRARKELILAIPATTGAGPRRRRMRPSPFLYELEPSSLHWIAARPEQQIAAS